MNTAPTGLPGPVTRMPRARRFATRGELTLYSIATIANAALAIWWLT